MEQYESIYEDGGIDVERLTGKSASSVEEVICVICHKILYEPASCITCENHFCQTCINKWKKNKNQCPFSCQLELKKPSKIVNSLLSKLRIKCYYQTNGCNYQEMYETVLKHEKTCEWKQQRKIGNMQKKKLVASCIAQSSKGIKSINEQDISGPSTSRQINPDRFTLLNEFDKKGKEKNVIEEVEVELGSCNDMEEENLEADNTGKKEDQGKNVIFIKGSSNLFEETPDVEMVEEESESEESQASSQKLIEWLEASNGVVNKLSIKLHSKEKRLFTADVINQGEEILFIPGSILITPKLVRNSELGKAVKNAKLNIEENILYLTIFLLQEKLNPSSTWKPYLDNLPDNYFSLALFFDDYELHWLRGSMLFEQVRGKREEMKKLFKVISGKMECSYDDFCWAFSNANSRYFEIKQNGNVMQLMIPIADLIGCSISDAQTCLDFDNLRNGFVVRASKNLSKNEILLSSAGKLSNHHFLLNQGTFFENNPNDEVEINLFFNDFDPLINYRRQILRNEDEPFIFKLKNDISLSNLGMFLAFLRIVEVTAKEDLKKDLNFYVNNAISIGIEKKVIKKMELILKSRLKNYDTTSEQDEKLLNSDLVTDNQKKCLKIRISEKRICRALITFAETIGNFLDKKIGYRELIKNKEYLTYLKTVENLKL